VILREASAFGNHDHKKMRKYMRINKTESAFQYQSKQNDLPLPLMSKHNRDQTSTQEVEIIVNLVPAVGHVLWPPRVQ